MSNQLKLTLVKSTFGRLKNHKDCAKGLGLGKMHSTSVIVATPENLGMVAKIRYMLKVEEL